MPVKSNRAKTTPKKKATGKVPMWTPEQIVHALKNSHGLVATAARAVGCARSTIYEYIERYPEVREARDEAREYLVDMAESGLVAKIRDGEGWAVCFALKTLGKNRGYTERQEIEQTTTHNMEPEMSAMLDKLFQGKK